MTDTLFDDVEGPARDPRRCATATQKHKIGLRDQDICQSCGRPLPVYKDQRGGHVDAHSLSGPTEVSNLLTLCEQCNTDWSTGRPHRLRPWQLKLPIQYLEHIKTTNDPFVLEACPGAGKTIAVKSLIQRLKNDRLIGGAIVVVPNRAVGFQWTGSYAGIHLGMVTSRQRRKASDYFGLVLTYQMLAEEPSVWLREINSWERQTGLPIAVIFDEAHHLGDQLSWGDAARTLAGNYPLILLTGTLWRSAGDRIPFVSYGTDGLAISHVSYRMSDALLDGGVLRRPVLIGIDGEARVVDRATMEIADLELSCDLDDTVISPALQSAIATDSDVLRVMLDRANNACDAHRAASKYGDNAILVVADDVAATERLQRLIKDKYGDHALIVHSNLDDPQQALANARDSKAKWILAVKMISEGVDIKRISTVVYASTTQTKLFFLQVVGRAVRLREGEQVDAVIVYPAISLFNAYAAEIEDMVPEGLKPEIDLACVNCGRFGYLLCPDCREPEKKPPTDWWPTPVLPAKNGQLGQVRVAGVSELLPGECVQIHEDGLRRAGAAAWLAEAAAPFLAIAASSDESDLSPPPPVAFERSISSEAPQSLHARKEALNKELTAEIRAAVNRSMFWVDERDRRREKRLKGVAFSRINASLNQRFGLRAGQRDKLTELDLINALDLLENQAFDLPDGWSNDVR
jgi:superfamily II DNA or RNA helicase